MATKGIVKGIVSNLVTVEVDGPVSQNEICYISVGGVKLMSEVIKVIGKNAFVRRMGFLLKNIWTLRSL